MKHATQPKPYDAGQASLRKISPLHASRMLTRAQMNDGSATIFKDNLSMHSLRKSIEKKRQLTMTQHE